MVLDLFKGGVPVVEEYEGKPVVTGIQKVKVFKAGMFVSPKNKKTFGLKLEMQVIATGVNTEEVIWKQVDGVEKAIKMKNGGEFKPFDSNMNDICRQIDLDPTTLTDASMLEGKEFTFIFESYTSGDFLNSRIQWANRAKNKPSGFKKPKEGYSQDSYSADAVKVVVEELDDSIPF